MRVNGRDLVELVTAFERAFAGDLAGQYQPLYTDALPPARHLFGDASPALWQEEDGRVPILGCVCGTPECWPLVARISVGTPEVRWHEFGQPWRPEWSYRGFGPFVFRREQYEATLRIGG